MDSQSLGAVALSVLLLLALLFVPVLFACWRQIVEAFRDINRELH